MNEKEMNELNNYFDSLDYELQMEIAKCKEHRWLGSLRLAETKLKMLTDIRSKIAEIKKE